MEGLYGFAHVEVSVGNFSCSSGLDGCFSLGYLKTLWMLIQELFLLNSASKTLTCNKNNLTNLNTFGTPSVLLMFLQELCLICVLYE